MRVLQKNKQKELRIETKTHQLAAEMSARGRLDGDHAFLLVLELINQQGHKTLITCRCHPSLKAPLRMLLLTEALVSARMASWGALWMPVLAPFWVPVWALLRASFWVPLWAPL